MPFGQTPPTDSGTKGEFPPNPSQHHCLLSPSNSTEGNRFIETIWTLKKKQTKPMFKTAVAGHSETHPWPGVRLAPGQDWPPLSWWGCGDAHLLLRGGEGSRTLVTRCWSEPGSLALRIKGGRGPSSQNTGSLGTK